MIANLICPKCGSTRFNEDCLTSNPAMYEATCYNECGIRVSCNKRLNPNTHVAQSEVDTAAKEMIKLKFINEETK